jgi:hypothetical protein
MNVRQMFTMLFVKYDECWVELDESITLYSLASAYFCELYPCRIRFKIKILIDIKIPE